MGDRVLYNTLFNFREYTELVNLLLVKYYFIIDFFIKEKKNKIFCSNFKVEISYPKKQIVFALFRRKKTDVNRYFINKKINFYL